MPLYECYRHTFIKRTQRLIVEAKSRSHAETDATNYDREAVRYHNPHEDEETTAYEGEHDWSSVTQTIPASRVPSRPGRAFPIDVQRGTDSAEWGRALCEMLGGNVNKDMLIGELLKAFYCLDLDDENHNFYVNLPLDTLNELEEVFNV